MDASTTSTGVTMISISDFCGLLYLNSFDRAVTMLRRVNFIILDVIFVRKKSIFKLWLRRVA